MAAPIPVSEDLYRVLEASISAAEQSDGAFDVTVGPLVHLWRRSRELVQLPTTERLAAARASVGYRYIRLTRIGAKTSEGRAFASPAIQLMAAKMRLDLGGIVTGYATTDVLRVLREHGVSRALIDAAGDLAASDPPPGKDGWRVAIQAIENPSNTVGYVKLANRACSTSGDTYRYVEIDGVRYSHIVDPKTGLGLTSRTGVTVIADDGTTADWLDTALPVMPLDEAKALVERLPGVAARITTIAPDGGIAVWESSRFKPFWDNSPVTTTGPATTPSQDKPSPAEPE
jgi:thiamine biosynthesis lipoprotein